MWLVCDYGGVLSLDQPEADQDVLVGLSGLDEVEFWARYWRHRPPYDRADLTVAEYWTIVLGAEPSTERLEALVRVDIASWLHPNMEAVEAAVRAGSRGMRLAVLSNAPHEIARGIESLACLGPFEARFFSCDLGSVKPEAAIYRSVIEALGSDPAELVFFDDREDNVVAAAAVGIHAHLFTDASQLEIDPLRPTRPGSCRSAPGKQ